VIRLVTSALVSYPDPNSRVFRILMSQLGSLRVCSHKWLWSTSQVPTTHE
jgi:hypothetical protein